MSRTASRPIDRNGLVGDFDRFAPVRMSLDEIVDAAMAEKRGDRRPRAPRPPVLLLSIDDHALVRYHLGSDEVRTAHEIVGVRDHWVPPEAVKMTAIFGIVGPDGEPRLLLEVIDDPNEGRGPSIAFAFPSKVHGIPQQALLGLLSHLDLPPSRRMGIDLKLAEAYDVHWNDEAGAYEAKPPRHLIMMTFERTCFMTAPPMRESVDVYVLPDPDCDLDDPDADKAYWARDHYRNLAWNEMHRLPQMENRPGFSSWTSSGNDPVRIKVLSDSLDAVIDRLTAEAEQACREAPDEDAPSAPAP